MEWIKTSWPNSIHFYVPLQIITNPTAIYIYIAVINPVILQKSHTVCPRCLGPFRKVTYH